MVLARGRRSLHVTDHTKFGRRGRGAGCGSPSHAGEATDRPPPPELAAVLQDAGTRLAVAQDA
jgi:DeoR family glycerol-3-phosphate regulon repressor